MSDLIDDPATDPGLTPDERIVAEAKDRWKQADERESRARTNFLNDMRFANGDSYNGWQWPGDMARERGQRPSLTCNKVRQHCLQVINDARQNKAQVEVRPVGGGADFRAAQVFEGIVRHIEYISNAQAAYDAASWNQVIGGLGWWRIVTDYANDDSEDQEIYIKRVGNPLSVYIDPDIQEYDGSDADYGFVWEDMPRYRFKSRYPRYYRKMQLGQTPFGEGGGDGPIGRGDGWDDENHIRVCEYYRKVKRIDRPASRREGYGDTDAPRDDRQRRDDDRERVKIEWFLICGSEIVDRREWPGNYIPLVRVVGEEFEVDGVLDRRGHTRALIDAQRMYNYWTSAAVEQVALQSKAPFVGPKEAFENIPDWENANTKNLPYLAYNGRDEMGQPVERPQREQPPVMADAYINGMKIAAEEFRMASGQYQADMGAPSNERSGRAIEMRQRQGQNSTYHFIEHLAQAIRFTGKILIDLIPKIYDTQRVLKILGEDGKQTTVQIDPTAPVAYQRAIDPRTGQPVPGPDDDNFDPSAVAAIFNPTVGQYSVVADIGPAYATKRQQAFDSMVEIIKENPALSPVVGDLMFRSADFPLSDEIAERLKRMVPPQALGKGPDPQTQQLMAQLQQAQHAVVALQGQLQQAQAKADMAQANAAKASAAAAMTQAKMAGQQAQHLMSGGEADREWYDSETKRMAAIGAIDPAALMPIIRQMVGEVLQANPLPAIRAHQLHDGMVQQAIEPPEPAPTVQ